MSESIVRKIQPFTIGTKLSVPNVPKCPDFEDAFLPTQSLDSCKLQNSLNDQVGLYLGQSQMQTDSPQLSPTGEPETTSKGQTDDPTKEDNLNRNGVSPTSSSRSIKKITISGSLESPGDTPDLGGDCLVSVVTSKPESININNNNNNNNNNMVDAKPVPRIVGVSCENTPNSHLKVLLRKDITAEDKRKDIEEGPEFKNFGDTTTSICETSPPRVPSPIKDLLSKERPPCGTSEAPPSSRPIPANADCSYTQCNTLFNREVQQAEAWIKGKLQDLKDGWDVQRSPLQDWGEVSQTLQRDLKDFENTLIQLNQMGEQLVCAQNPNSDLVKKQLTRLEDQWHALKQMAANQSKALGGARNLQQFNRKADRLETWIKEKQEEERSLAGVLGENVDKIQLTRRILDLKEDEQQYQTLHEEINHLALKLEKQGKMEGKNISVRRKHINKMWLKVQSLLKDYHENLQLALEVSSFYQQADNLISAINHKKKSAPWTHEQENCGDREIREIASQIAMLDVTASQLSNLHPTLACRVSLKQCEVKDTWATIQRADRNERSGLLSADPDFTREDADPKTPSWDAPFTQDKETHRIMGKEVKEEQNRLKGCTSVRDPGIMTNCQDEEQPLKSSAPVKENCAGIADDDVIERHQSEGKSSEERAIKPEASVSGGDATFCVQLQESAASAEKTLLWLKDSVAMTTQVRPTPGLEGSRLLSQEEILSCRPKAKREGKSSLCPENVRVDDFLYQLEHLWEELQRRHQPTGAELQHSRKLNQKGTGALMELRPLEAWLQMAGASHRQSPPEGVPETLSQPEGGVSPPDLELDVPRQEGVALQEGQHLQEEVEEKYRRGVQRGRGQELQHPTRLTGILGASVLDEGPGQSLPSEMALDDCLRNVPEVRGEVVPMGIGEPLEELRVAVEILKDTAFERVIQPIRELLGQCSSLMMRINHALSLGAELSMDIMDAETDMAVKCEPDRSGLQGLQEQQDQMEVKYEALKDEVAEMEKQGPRLEALCPEKWPILGEEVQATLQAWEELGRSMAENRGRLQQFGRLQDFFRDYLAMISWTEDTRACIFSESARHRGKGNEVPVTSELDLKIERKFEEFDELAAAGQKLMEEEHHLAELIKERTEELQSMLGWILVHWRAQKHQRSRGKRKEGDVVCSEATVPTATGQKSGSPHCQRPSQQQPASEGGSRSPGSQLTSKPGCHDDRQDGQPSEEGDGGTGIGGSGRKDSDSGSAKGPPESREPPFLVLKEPGAPSLGGTVNLILSFGKVGDSLLQVQKPEEDAEVPEPVHRVSTYLHVKDNHKTVAPVDEVGSPPHLDSKTQEPTQTSISSPSSSSSISVSPTQVSSVAFHTLPKRGSASNSALSPAPSSTISSAPSSTISSASCSTTSTGASSYKISAPCSTISSNPCSAISFVPSSTISSAPCSTISSSPCSAISSAPCFTFNSAPCCTSSSQKGRSKNRKRVVAQRVMAVARQEVQSPSRDPVTQGTSTWPLKERKKRCTSSTQLTTAEPLDLAKRPLVETVSAQCVSQSKFTPSVLPGSLASSRGASASQVKNHCRHLSLGSVLSFDLPKDLSLIPSIHDVITISPPGSAGADLPSPIGQCSPADPQPATISSNQMRSPLKGGDIIKLSPQGQTTVQSDCVASHRINLQATLVSANRQNPSLNPKQTLPSDDLSDPQMKDHSDIRSLNADTSQKWDQREATAPNSRLHQGNSQKAGPPKEDSCKTFTCSHGATSLSVAHVCPSVHTKIQDLAGHIYHPPMRRQNAHIGDRPANQSAVSHSVVAPASCVIGQQRSEGKAAFGSGHARLSGTEGGETAPPDAPLPRRTVGRVLSLERAEPAPRGRKGVAMVSMAADTIRPDHRQFEEEEEELEDIWNQTNGYRQGDACQQTNHGEAEATPTTEPRVSSPSPTPRSQNVLYTTVEAANSAASTSNLLVAEFRLPAEVQALLGYSAPCRSPTEQPGRQKVPETQTAAPDLLNPPDVERPQKHPAHDRGRGLEREREDADGGSEVCPKVQSVSWLPVCMGAGEKSQQPMGSGTSSSDIQLQGHVTTTRGHCSSMNGNRSEVQSMEGPLERKHLLEKGKKAPHCAWDAGHALLFKRSLRFCREREDGLQSGEPVLTLDLTGAQCTPAPDCSERPHCFSLRLCDGSEYLLSSSSSSLMKEWVLRIQAIAGLSEMDSSGYLSSTLGPTSHCTAGDDITSSHSGPFQSCGARAKELVILTGDTSHGSQRNHGILEDNSPPLSSDAGGHPGPLSQAGTQPSPLGPLDPQPGISFSNSQDCPSVKQRSHSFTSATYQKITPAPLPHGIREGGSSYSVTLFIGDQQTGAPPPEHRAESPALIGQQWEALQDSLSDKSCGTPTKSQKKSVFKKFFGKERF
ncbi:uncharacterized protein LOC135244803 isoform X2 [Anguilla rostrata]|uniref:uncharacterized protein LOC135244803 isoform X2 n=1 Tax=Anguilla rostrata TaxID=7938 RepID=UPI0030CB8CDE